MKKQRYVVDVGSSYTTVYRDGLLLKEPTVAAVRKTDKLELLAAGSAVYALIGKLSEHDSFIKPVENGAVVNAEVAALMLKSFFSKTISKKIKSNIEVVCPVSCGLSIAERENLENAVTKAGCGGVSLAESLMGLLPFVDKRGQAVMLIGGGVTDIGVLNQDGIAQACSVNLGGIAIDGKIAERVLDVYKIKISSRTAETLKNELASLYENDTSVMEVTGRDILDGSLKSQEISAESIRPAVVTCVKTLLEVTESLLTTLPQSMIGEITSRGLYLAGGAAKMQGMSDFMAKYLKIPVFCDKEPDTAVLRGLYSSHKEMR